MDDLDKAILCSYEVAIDPALKSQAISYCEQIKSSSPSICRFCIERLAITDLVPVQFWCLQTIQDALRLRYSYLDASDLAFLRESLQSIACGSGGGAAARVCNGPSFIKNKFAQVFVGLIYFEYPSVWSTIFLQLLQNLGKGNQIIDVFSRILVSLDDEIISMDYQRSAEEVAVASRIKDGMRLQCVPRIVRVWYDIVSAYRISEPELAMSILDAMRRHITWIDIGLIANDVFVSMLFEIIMNDNLLEQLRAAASSCVNAIVLKRMDAKPKVSLLRSLQVGRVFCLVSGGGDSELVSALVALIISYAAEALDCVKRLGSMDVDGAAMQLLETALPSVFCVMQNCEVDSAGNAVKFLTDYVSMMKSLTLTSKKVLQVEKILEVIKAKITYSPMYRDNLDLPDKIGREKEDEMSEHRRDFFTLLRSISRIAPDDTQLFIQGLLENAIKSHEMTTEEVEATLSLFYRLGEAVSDEGIRTGGGQLKEMIPMLLSAHFLCHKHRIVALIYLETVTRYMKFVQENPQYIHHMLSAFLDERGIHHPNPDVSKRACYLFMRAVKLLKSQLVPFVESILQSLQGILGRFASLDWSSKELKSSSYDNGSHIFEAIGLLIGMEDVVPEKQYEYLSALLTPLCQQVEFLLVNANVQILEESSSKIASIQQITTAINALSKGFSERLVTATRPTLGAMFKQTLDVLLKVLAVFPKLEPLRKKITSFLHRMVETLGESIFPYLPIALEKLLTESEPNEMVDFLVLINQLICKFGTSFGSILEEIFPTVASRLFRILPNVALTTGPGSNTEEIRELQELQKTLYTFLHILTTHNLSSVLLVPKSRKYMDVIIQLLLSTSCNHKVIVLRKMCVQIIVRLIKDWCTKFNGEEKVPGFRTYIVENFAINCCLFSVLDRSFNFRDANTLVLFGEIMVAQKVMYEKFGNDFLIHFVSKGLSAAHCSQDLAEQYCHKIQGDDMNTLKSFYLSLVENLRQEQNGGLVFR